MKQRKQMLHYHLLPMFIQLISLPINRLTYFSINSAISGFYSSNSLYFKEIRLICLFTVSFLILSMQNFLKHFDISMSILT
jgi:hypothetical protein